MSSAKAIPTQSGGLPVPNDAIAVLYLAVEAYAIWSHLAAGRIVLALGSLVLLGFLYSGIRLRQQSHLIASLGLLIPLFLAEITLLFAGDSFSLLKLVHIALRAALGAYLSKTLLNLRALLLASTADSLNVLSQSVGSGLAEGLLTRLNEASMEGEDRVLIATESSSSPFDDDHQPVETSTEHPLEDGALGVAESSVLPETTTANLAEEACLEEVADEATLGAVEDKLEVDHQVTAESGLANDEEEERQEDVENRLEDMVETAAFDDAEKEEGDVNVENEEGGNDEEEKAECGCQVEDEERQQDEVNEEDDEEKVDEEEGDSEDNEENDEEEDESEEEDEEESD